MRARCQVDDEHGTAVVILDHDLTDHERTVLAPLVEGLRRQDLPRLLAELIRQQADEAAYQRVCAAKGLLL